MRHLVLLTREDQEAMLANVREHLVDDGRFMMDTGALAPSRLVNAPEAGEWYTHDHPNARKIYVSGTDRFDFQPDGELVRPPWTLTLRYFMPQEIETILHYNGFEIKDRYSGYEGTLPTSDVPARVYICVKR